MVQILKIKLKERLWSLEFIYWKINHNNDKDIEESKNVTVGRNFRDVSHLNTTQNNCFSWILRKVFIQEERLRQ